MTFSVRDAEILVTEPGSSASPADFTVPASDIVSATVRERAGREVAKGTITLDNSTQEYTVGARRIDRDDQLVFRLALTGDAQAYAFGEGPFGAGAFGTSAWRVSSTLIVTDWEVSGPEWNSTLTIDVEDFVANRLRAHPVHHTESVAPISGSSDAHLNSVLAEYVPEVDTSLLPTISDTVDYASDGKRGHKVVDDLGLLAHDATGESIIVGSSGTALTFQSLGELSSLWTADSDRRDFRGGFTHASASDNMVNEVRVEGGIDDEGNVDQEQLTHDTDTTVTSSSRVTTQLDPRKPEITKVSLRVKHKTGSSDDLRVRLQSDSGGAPVDVDDTDSDLASTSFEVPDGFDDTVTVRFGQHTLGPGSQPWLIIEGSGSDGVIVRTDSATGDPWYQTYFSKPVIVKVPHTLAQDTYRVHGEVVKASGLVTFNAARDRARAELDRRAYPKLELGPLTAASERAHELSVADVITVGYDWLRASGEYIVVGVEHRYRGSTLDTEVSLVSEERYA